MERNIRYDVIRVVAIFFVICIHSMGLVNDAVHNGDQVARVVNSIGGIIYSGVPLFVMLSGALLLGKQEPMKLFFKKRMTRLLIPFLVWSVVVGAILYYLSGGRSIGGFVLFDLKGIVTGGVHPIYWYVYMIIGLYFLTPILRVVADSKNGDRLLLYFSVLIFIVAVFGELFPSVVALSHWVCPNLTMLFYYLSGFLLAKAIQTQYKSCNYKLIFGILFIVLYVTFTITRYFGIEIPGLKILLSLSLFGALLSASFRMSSNRVRNIIQRISKYSYGLYLSHIMLVSAIVKTGIPYMIPLYLEPVLMAITVLVVDMLILFVLDKLRLGKYVM